MRLIAILSTILLAGAGSLAAQEYGVEITCPSVTVAGAAVNVSMVIDVQKTDIECDGSYRLVPYIENGGVRLNLPEVVYAGSQRYKFDRRREHISGAYVPEAYKVFPKANRRKPEIVEYNVSVPYSPWMGDARVAWEWTVNDCRGEAVLFTGRFDDKIEVLDYRQMANPDLYTDVVLYAPGRETYRDEKTNEVVSGKRRHVSTDLYVTFPQDVPDIISDYRSNFDELRKADSLMNYILDNDLVSSVEISIHGYASPEGALWRNTNLSKYRAQNVRKYLYGKFNLSGLPVSVEWTPVDWQGLREILSGGNIPYGDDIIRIIDNTPGEEERERIITGIIGRDLHNRLMEEIYPRLRRTVLRADFTVPDFTPAQAREMIHTNPELLGLEEMYSAAEFYEEGTYEHTETYLLAARQFPDDFVANNNAAAVLLREGNSREAYKYLIKISDDPRSYSNIGTYYYLEGDIDRAKAYFRMALQAGTQGTRRRLEMLGENN